MKFTAIDPPRLFRVGPGGSIELRDCARIALDDDEQVTFVTPAGAEYDVVRKAWGFYATPSLNGRLRDFGLRGALVRSQGRYYVLLVQQEAEAAFQAYLRHESMTIVRWLDDGAALDSLAVPTLADDPAVLHCMCGADRFTRVHLYESRPAGEVGFPSTSGPYRREIRQCALCRHFVSVHAFETDSLYDLEYVNSTYGDAARVRSAFERVVSLPPERSDNAARVARIIDHLGPSAGTDTRSVLDVGSGLCVFLDRMKAAGWSCTAVDPDERAVAHAREHVGVDAIQGDFLQIEPAPRFDLVTFNKVLEHVRDPIGMLARSRGFLTGRGVVYVEVPDGEAAAADGFGREEFFVEHHHVFSLASLALLCVRAGLVAGTIERVREPSGKYTLRAFCAASTGAERS